VEIPSSAEGHVVRRWLGNLSYEDFRAAHYQRLPCVAPGTAAATVPLLDWARVGRLLAGDADVMVVRNARMLPEVRPRDARAARILLGGGYSVVIRGCEDHDPDLRALADSVGRDFEGEVAVQVFVTPAGFESFGWHYDCEDVFIVQTGGAKDYFLRRNTVNPAPMLGMPHDMRFQQEHSAVIATTLIGGDWLYVPRGWWHNARALEESLSLSIGVLSPAARGESSTGPRAWTRHDGPSRS
jgi:hypothetical protein